MTFESHDFDQFFEPLVGDTNAQAQFRSDLSSSVKIGYGDQSPYQDLKQGYREIVMAVLADQTGTQFSPEERAKREIIATNATVTGIMAVEMLRTVGGIYSTHTGKTRIRQESASVHKNTNRTLQILLKMAFNSDEATLSMNFDALKLGFDPSNPRTPKRIEAYNRRHPEDKNTTRISRRSLKVEQIEHGQLLVTPRFKLSSLVEAIHCPAALNTVPRPKHRQSAIFAVMDSLAGAVQESIYPYEFLIDNKK